MAWERGTIQDSHTLGVRKLGKLVREEGEAQRTLGDGEPREREVGQTERGATGKECEGLGEWMMERVRRS